MEHNSEEIVINQKCRVTGTPWSVTVYKEDYDAWKGGKYAQDAFPYLTADEREFIISGTSPEGWEKLFG